MHAKVIEFNQKQREGANLAIEAGDFIRVHRKIKEGEKERIQVFEGLVIAKKGGQSSSPTITVRKSSFGTGVELILPLLSPGIEKIETVKRAKTRRSKLYFVRNKSDRELRRKLKEIPVQEEKKAQAVKTAKDVSQSEKKEAPKKESTEKAVKKEKK